MIDTMHRYSSRLIVRALASPIRVYQRWISPALPPRCRFYPTCSSYALEALAVHGPAKGLWLVVRRVTRCHPFHPGGYDPVPPKPTKQSRTQDSASVGLRAMARASRTPTDEGAVRWTST